MVVLELYRSTVIGKILSETLDEMVMSGKLIPELAILVQLQFDEVRSAVNANCMLTHVLNPRVF